VKTEVRAEEGNPAPAALGQPKKNLAGEAGHGKLRPSRSCGQQERAEEKSEWLRELSPRRAAPAREKQSQIQRGPKLERRPTGMKKRKIVGCVNRDRTKQWLDEIEQRNTKIKLKLLGTSKIQNTIFLFRFNKFTTNS
jgi:hypothetical protein